MVSALPAGNEVKEFYNLDPKTTYNELEERISETFNIGTKKNDIINQLLKLSEEQRKVIHLTQENNVLINYFFEINEENEFKKKYDIRVMFALDSSDGLKEIVILYDVVIANIEPFAGGDATR
ncbi:MAG: hypothetical protein AB3N10_16700 [Allomuricauda sp.]